MAGMRRQVEGALTIPLPLATGGRGTAAVVRKYREAQWKTGLGLTYPLQLAPEAARRA